MVLLLLLWGQASKAMNAGKWLRFTHDGNSTIWMNLLWRISGVLGLFGLRLSAVENYDFISSVVIVLVRFNDATWTWRTPEYYHQTENWIISNDNTQTDRRRWHTKIMSFRELRSEYPQIVIEARPRAWTRRVCQWTHKSHLLLLSCNFLHSLSYTSIFLRFYRDYEEFGLSSIDIDGEF